MKREDCTIGAQVYTDDGPLYRYDVLDLPDAEGFVPVKVAKDSWASGGVLFHLDDLHLFDEDELKKKAAELQAKVDAAKTAFEQAFDALREVQDFHENGVSRYSLQELELLSIDELEGTIERGGWSSSSLWC